MHIVAMAADGAWGSSCCTWTGARRVMINLVVVVLEVKSLCKAAAGQGGYGGGRILGLGLLIVRLAFAMHELGR